MTELEKKIRSFKEPYVPALPPGADDTASTHASTNQVGKTWQRMIDEQLIEWGRNPEQFDEDGVKPPTAKTLSVACDFAKHCRDRQTQPPLRVAPDGSGGIMFEWQIGSSFQTVEIDGNGKIEMLSFVNSKLEFRLPIG